MKSRLIVIVVIAAVLGYFIYSLYSRAIIKNIDLIEISWIEFLPEDGDSHEATEQFNLDLLAETIANYKYKKMPKHYGPYKVKDVTFKIDCVYNHRPLHIILGDINFVYTDASRGLCPIINGDELLAEVNLLFEQ